MSLFRISPAFASTLTGWVLLSACGTAMAWSTALPPLPPFGGPEARQYAALSPEQREQMREQIRQQQGDNRPAEERPRMREIMSPEQRQQFREQARERWQQQPPEHRHEFRERHPDRDDWRPRDERPRRF